MSGGYFAYQDSNLKTEIFGFQDKWWNALEDREISELVWDVLKLLHTFDYYRCDDTDKETYLIAKSDFKKKWFSNRGVRVRHTVDTAIEELRTELYETFGVRPPLKIFLPEEDHSEEFES